MPRAEFFTQLGLFAQKHFFSRSECLELRTAMDSSPSRPGTIWREGAGTGVIDESLKRRTEIASVEALSSVNESLIALMPTVASHFNLPLKGCEEGKLSVYREGDFYAPHVDAPASGPEVLKARRISLVIFLNSEVDEPEPGSYTGGALTFYGLMDKPPWNSLGLPLNGEEGMLIAFRPNVLHEVKPVTFGERYTVTNWFF